MNHPIHPRFIVNNNMMGYNSNFSTNESIDNEDVNRRFLTPNNMNYFERNCVYSQQKINFQNPIQFNNNLNVNQTNAYEEM